MAKTLEFVLAVASLLLLRLWVTRINLDHVPALGRPGIISSYFDLGMLSKDGVKIVAKAYRDFQGRMFKIPFLTYWAVVVCDPKVIDEVKNGKDAELSFEEPNLEVIQQKYTIGLTPGLPHTIIHTVRTSLTRSIASRFDDIRDEVVEAFSDCLPSEVEREWVPIMPLIAMRKVVCRISNRFFVGLPLCRDPDWLDLNINFTVDIFQCAEKIKKWPDILKPIVGLYYSPYKQAYRRGLRLVGPLIEERISNWGENLKEAPNDSITWFLESISESERDVGYIMKGIFMTNMAAIHTSSNSFAHALFRLALHPEHVEPMRKEVQEVVDEFGWSKAAMNEMRKVDSFFRETQRLDNIAAFTMRRKVVKPGGITFSDGSHLPQGTLILVPSDAIHHDETNFENPYEFDGFRFSKVREADKEDSPKHQMINVSATNFSFGNGRHACPGRFFAANELKAMMAHVLLTYDVKLREEGLSCGHIERNFSRIPSPERLLFRKRQQT